MIVEVSHHGCGRGRLSHRAMIGRVPALEMPRMARAAAGRGNIAMLARLGRHFSFQLRRLGMGLMGIAIPHGRAGHRDEYGDGHQRGDPLAGEMAAASASVDGNQAAQQQRSADDDKENQDDFRHRRRFRSAGIETS